MGGIRKGFSLQKFYFKPTSHDVLSGCVKLVPIGSLGK